MSRIKIGRTHVLIALLLQSLSESFFVNASLSSPEEDIQFIQRVLSTSCQLEQKNWRSEFEKSLADARQRASTINLRDIDEIWNEIQENRRKEKTHKFLSAKL